MKPLPKTKDSLFLRTDFSDDAAWESLCELAQQPNDEDFRAYINCVSDQTYAGMTIQHLLDSEELSNGNMFVFLADQQAQQDPEHPVLVVDLDEERGRSFRVIPSELWSVENNLDLANMDFEDFTDNLDENGIFRGF